MRPMATRLAAIETKFQTTPCSVMASVPSPSTAIPIPSRGSQGATRLRSRLATRHNTLPATKVTTPSQSSTTSQGAGNVKPPSAEGACSVVDGSPRGGERRPQHAKRERKERRAERGRDA